ncbi:multicopper oxidase domain-containing protein [Lysobacter sp. K5869]|uniref:multicopper oxidase family protein n=1 Tax=Lysobacter sp. K5869 TaxID=2820808 RepID=UPI001C06474F|nr:multicopper oxidase domain-containing protein [Lysobacter sp. K5869]QWP76882.1 multicopper oxidase domain-containing protein [Lysobacter sp. K5869]
MNTSAFRPSGPRPTRAALALCLALALPGAALAQDAAPAPAASALRVAAPPVLARMLRSTDAPETAQKLLTSTGARPLDTREAKLDLVIGLTTSKIWNPATQRFDTVELRSYKSPGTDPAIPFVAPTVVTAPGETVRIALKNDLKPEPDCAQPSINTPHCFNSTNLHSHGLWVSPTGNSDNVLLTLRPGVSFEYEYNLPADHPSGTFWYHPHLHGSTALQVSSGMAGALLVRGERLPSATRNGDLDTLLRESDGKPMAERLLMFQQVAYACRDGKNNIKTASDGRWVCDPGDVGRIESYDQFGRNVWKTSGRYTSVNGVVLPTLSGLVAGRVERWRLLHAGVRDTVNLQLRELRPGVSLPQNLAGKALDNWVGKNCTGPVLSQFEVASDGLTHGRAIEKRENVLQPGYRSDVLMVFPNAGRYCVIDMAAPAIASVTQEPEDRQLLGIAEVGGDARVADPRAAILERLTASAERNMPTDVRARVLAELHDGFGLSAFAPHRDIPESEVNGHQKLVFDISGDTYMVDGKPYSPTQSRDLVLGRTEEWDLSSDTGSHPFHIHVNPFQIVAIYDRKGKDVSEKGEPDDPQYANLKGTWKDTLFVKEKYHLIVRTRYERYIGEYVLHCHILDHEDHGMMQNVRMLVPDGKGGGIVPGHHH